VSDGLSRLAQAWDEAAAGYEDYFVPRFAPWVGTAIDALGELPAGPVLVPCCGTFPELEPLVRRWPGREFVGIDLSPEMVRMASARVASYPPARAIVADASALDPGWTGECAGVVSVFGLQQLPEPAEAVRKWAAALRPGGRMSVVYWPEQTESEGPFALLAEVRTRHTGGTSDRSWEDELPAAVTAAGATLERNDLVSHEIRYADAAEFWTAMTTSGPARALALARGDEFMSRLRDDFLAAAPTGPWSHHPQGRLIVATR
jgi:trans-aconitate methyltransferase